jgi:hypothetical protein
MALSPIFASFNSDRSRSGATDLCINLYPEHTDGEKGPEVSLLLSCPGLTAPLAVADGGPVREVYRASNNKMYVVSGSGVYVVDTSWNITFIGSIGTSSGPVYIIDNPTQVGIYDGAAGWTITKATNAMVKTIPDGVTSAASPSSACYQDGFGLINSTDNQIYQSNYNDLSSFAQGGTANNAYVQGNSEAVVAVADIRREVWVWKKDAVEVWVNNGNSGFAFTQLQGVYIPCGCTAAASVSRLGDGFVWLGEDDQGNATVFMSVGYQAKPITTHALVALFQTFTTVSDAISYSYQSGDHRFYVLTFPTANATYAYDLQTGKWHQRASFSNGQFNRERANCHCWFNGKHVVGDYQNGNLYALDDNTFTDNGAVRKWLRSWRALPDSLPVGVPMSFDELQILMETGITPAQGTNPQIMLRWSNDGGYTWPGQRLLPAGKPGETTNRVLVTRLGSTTIGTGLDRIWEISGTDAIKVSITGASWEGGPA